MDKKGYSEKCKNCKEECLKPEKEVIELSLSVEEKVQVIKDMCLANFKKLGAIPEDESEVENVKLDSELRRILAINDRVSYLAKGLITQTVYDDAKTIICDFSNMIHIIEKSLVSDNARRRAIRAIAISELDAIIEKLGLHVEVPVVEDVPDNILKYSGHKKK